MKHTVNKLLHYVIKNINVTAKVHGPAEAARMVENNIRRIEEVSSESVNKEQLK